MSRARKTEDPTRTLITAHARTPAPPRSRASLIPLSAHAIARKSTFLPERKSFGRYEPSLQSEHTRSEIGGRKRARQRSNDRPVVIASGERVNREEGGKYREPSGDERLMGTESRAPTIVRESTSGHRSGWPQVTSSSDCGCRSRRPRPQPDVAARVAEGERPPVTRRFPAPFAPSRVSGLTAKSIRATRSSLP